MIPLDIRFIEVRLDTAVNPYGLSMVGAAEFAFIVDGMVMTREEFACHDEACRPPNKKGTGGTGGSLPGNGSLPSGKHVAPRFDRTAAGKKAGNKPRLGPHSSITDFDKTDQDKMVADFVKVTGLTHLKTAEDVIKFLMVETDRQMAEAKAADPTLTARYWYEAAHAEAENLSNLLGAETSALGSALIAVTSPQTPYPDNLAMAREIARLYNSGEKISAQTLRDAYNDTNNKELKFARDNMTEAEFIKAYGNDTWATINTKIGGAIFKSHLQYADPPILSVDQVLTIGGKGKYTEVLGSKIVAKSGESGYKALEILNAHAKYGESQEFYDVLSARLGEGSKVRSFYNNINTPESADYVTIDTHAASGMTGFPGGSGTPFVKGVMTPGSVTLGMSQSYGLYQEAINRIAEKYGVLPREVQSITWVQQRDVEWPDTVKSDYTGTGKATNPEVSHLQRQIALSMRGAKGVIQGRKYRDKIRDLIRERAAVGKKKDADSRARFKTINEEIDAIDRSLDLTDDELRSARQYAAPTAVYNKEKREGVTVP